MGVNSRWENSLDICGDILVMVAMVLAQHMHEDMSNSIVMQMNYDA